MVVFVLQGLNKRLSVLNNRNLFWRLGSGSRCWQGCFLLRSLFLVWSWLPSHCVLTWPLYQVCIPEIHSSYKDPVPIGLEPLTYDHVQPYYYFKDPPNIVTLGFSTSTYEFFGGGITIQSIIMNYLHFKEEMILQILIYQDHLGNEELQIQLCVVWNVYF